MFFQYGLPRAGGVSHVPPGWDQWIALVSLMLKDVHLDISSHKEAQSN